MSNLVSKTESNKISASTVKTEPKMRIKPDMSVSEVQQRGSCGQKIAAPLFDKDNSKDLNFLEAQWMNNCVFKVGNNTLTIYDNNFDGYTKVTEIKYDNLDQLYGNGLNYYNAYQMSFGKQDENDFGFMLDTIKFDKVTIDLSQKKVNVSGATNALELNANKSNLTVDNSSCKKINVNEGQLNINNSNCGNIALNNGATANLKNVKDAGKFLIMPTVITTNADTSINCDSDSKVKINKRTNTKN